MTNTTPPERIQPDQQWQYLDLWTRINGLIPTLPSYFRSELVVKGVNATDLYSLGPAFSTAIESSLVDSLNKMRNFWDAQSEYLTLAFKRQSQTFPDVLLVDVSQNDQIIKEVY